jgi:hypothetical protein
MKTPLLTLTTLKDWGAAQVVERLLAHVRSWVQTLVPPKPKNNSEPNVFCSRSSGSCLSVQIVWDTISKITRAKWTGGVAQGLEHLS